MLLPIREKRIEPDITAVEQAGRRALGREGQRIETDGHTISAARAGAVGRMVYSILTPHRRARSSVG